MLDRFLEFYLITTRRLDRLSRLDPVWDGDDCPLIESETIEVARKLCDRIPLDLLGPPEIVPDRTGSLLLEWYDGMRTLELELQHPRTIVYRRRHDEQGVEEEEIFPSIDVNAVVALMKRFAERSWE